MTRTEWTEQFYAEWAKRTVYYNHDGISEQTEDQHICEDTTYNGIDFSVNNEWVSGSRLYFGAPYRKEVSPDDILGTYQSSWFKVEDGRIVEVGGGYEEAGYFHYPGAERNVISLEIEKDLFELFPDPKSAVAAFGQEVGLMY